MAIEVGTIVEGVVTGITNFGAFITLPGGVTGLVHISEVADAYVKDVKDYLKEQDQVQVKVINVDAKGKIGLSIKQAKPPVAAAPAPTPRPFVKRDRPPIRSAAPETFEDKLSKFIKESEQKQLEFRRSTDAKRGGRGAGRS